MGQRAAFRCRRVRAGCALCGVQHQRYHKGHPPRLRGWDYAACAPYFVTFKVERRRSLLGRLAAGGCQESRAGLLVREVWGRLPDRFPGAVLDAMVIMPDHVHAILWTPGTTPVGHTDPCGASIHQGPDSRMCNWPSPAITNSAGNCLDVGRLPGALMNQGPTRICPTLDPLMADPRLVLGKVVRSWKADASRLIRRTGWTDFAWQSRYYEHVIRSPAVLDRVRAYIRRNPTRAAQH